MTFLEQENLHPVHQLACRKYHSTETAVLKTISDALFAADRGEIALLCLLDLFAAFHTLDQDIRI